MLEEQRDPGPVGVGRVVRLVGGGWGGRGRGGGGGGGGGGRGIRASDSPATDLIDGIARFPLRITPPPANREIDGIFEFDTDNLSVLFS